MNEIVFLVILTLNSVGGAFVYNYHEMESMQQCYECIEKSKISIPDGGDSEAVVAMYCAKGKVKRFD